jgi:hypothetical protein
MNRLQLATTLGLGSLILGLSACSSSPSTTAATSPAPPTSSKATHSATQPQPVQTENAPPGDIPDNQAFVTYTGKSGDYSVKIPEGWARTTTHGSVYFTDKLNSITVYQSSAASASTIASATKTDVATLKTSVPQFSLDKVSTFTRDGGSGILITYQADSAPDPVTNKVIRDAVERYTFWKKGQQVVLTLSGPVNADNVDPWALVSGSFRWLM